MSKELKAVHFMTHFNGEYEAFYPKAEADAVIAEKDAKILALDAEVVKQKHHAKLFLDERNYAETQLRHSNRKRCLAMAMWCDSEMNYWYDRTMREQCQRFKFYEKWYKRWLELADNFKEAK